MSRPWGQCYAKSSSTATLRAEWRKHAREGEAYAQLRSLLGFPALHVAWALCVAGLAILTIALGQPWVLVPTLVVFFAPTGEAVSKILGHQKWTYTPRV